MAFLSKSVPSWLMRFVYLLVGLIEVAFGAWLVIDFRTWRDIWEWVALIAGTILMIEGCIYLGAALCFRKRVDDREVGVEDR